MFHQAIAPGLLAMDEGDIIKVALIGGFIVGGILAYRLIDVVGGVLRTRQTEQTRRELAAYVAEGSITPEQAERMLSAGAPTDWASHVATMVQSGMIDSGDAERLLKAHAGGQARAPEPARS